MSSKRVVRSFAILASSSLVTQVIGFAALAVVARRTGPDALGAFSFTMAVVAYVSLPITGGITNLGVRDVARNPERVREIAGEIFLLQSILALGLYALIVVVGPLVAPTEEAGDLMPVLGLMLLTGTSFEWTLQGLQEMRLMAIARLVGQVCFGALVPFVVISGFAGVERYAWLFIGGLAVKQVLTIVFLARRAGLPRFRVGAARLWRRLVASLPMGFAVVMVQVYYQIDFVMLGYLDTSAAVGQYGVAYRIPAALLALGATWVAAMYPHSAALAGGDRDRLRRDVGVFGAAVALVALPLAACAPFVADGLMVTLFGSDFAPAGTPFALLMVAVALALFSGNFTAAVLALGGERRFAIAVTLAAALNAGLNVLLIPSLGTTGAAIDTIAAEAVVLTFMMWHARELLDGLRMQWWRVARAAVATVPAVLALVVLDDALGPLALVAIGGGIYVACALALRAIRPSELAILLPRNTPTPAPAAHA
jgi:O-antigen/teichoic acid export membrane protein